MNTGIGSLEWAEHNGGKLTLAEKLVLARSILRPVTLGMARHWLHLDDTKALEYSEIPLPQSVMLTSAARTVAALASPALLAHAWRTYYWAAAFGVLDEIQHDPELLLAGSLLHVLGATPAHHDLPDSHCFAVDSARATLQWAMERNMPDAQARRIADMITLFLNGHVTPAQGAEAHLLQQGVSCDVIGARSNELAPAYRERVLRQFPMQDFLPALAAFMEREARLRPHSRTALLKSAGLGLLMRANPLAPAMTRSAQ